MVSVQCGRVSSNYDEIVVCTYTGWIFALTTEQIVKPRPNTKTALTPQIEVKVQQLRYSNHLITYKISFIYNLIKHL